MNRIAIGPDGRFSFGGENFVVGGHVPPKDQRPSTSEAFTIAKNDPYLAPTDYETRIRAQIAQYANPEGLIQLGPIYRYWIYKHIRPRIAEVFGVNDALLFYAKYAAEALRQPCASRRIVSLGAGDCVYEILLIKKLLEMGETDFVLEAIELSPLRFDRARASASAEGVENLLLTRATSIHGSRPGNIPSLLPKTPSTTCWSWSTFSMQSMKVWSRMVFF